MWVGWDWAAETHDVTVIDDGGRAVDHWVLRHDEAGIDAALARLSTHAPPGELAVAIETTSGVVVDRLLAAGHPVVPVHPNAFWAARPRWGTSRAKTDRGDSFKLADYLRTDGHRLRRLRLPCPVTAELVALSRMRDDHVEARVAATNQLAALLGRHWPGAVVVFARLDSAIALAFLEDYPTPASAERLGEARMAMFCRRHSYSGRRSPAELVARLRSAPQATEELAAATLARLVATQGGVLRTLMGSIAQLDRALETALTRHPKATLLESLPRVGLVNLAQLLAEVGPILDRATDVEHASSEIGATPVTRESGRSRTVHFRWAANTRARRALGIFADNSRHASPWAAQLYKDARSRGQRHPQAIRVLMRAWLRVIWVCWHTDTAYNPARHGAERRHAQQHSKETAA